MLQFTLDCSHHGPSTTSSIHPQQLWVCAHHQEDSSPACPAMLPSTYPLKKKNRRITGTAFILLWGKAKILVRYSKPSVTCLHVSPLSTCFCLTHRMTALWANAFLQILKAHWIWLIVFRNSLPHPAAQMSPFSQILKCLCRITHCTTIQFLTANCSCFKNLEQDLISPGLWFHIY